jgi:bifunctional non-homologous end joining protein LigD
MQVLDWELVVVDKRGHPVWASMRRRAMISRPSWALDAAKNEPATLCTFDLLACDGHDMRDLPLLERKVRLADAIAGIPGVQIVGHLEAHGEALFGQVIDLGLEGIVAKRADSPYRAGRQPTWIKIKNQEYARREALRFR